LTQRKCARRVVGRLARHDLGRFDSVDISCAGDFHIGDPHADFDMVREWCEWLNEAPNRYGVVAGDVLNMATRNSVSFEYGVMHPKEARKMATRLLAPAAHKIKAVVVGNHDWRGEKETGIDPLEWVCTELGIPYYDAEAALLFQVGQHRHHRTSDKRQPVSYVGYLAHGCRGGRTAASKIAGVLAYRDVIPNADFYVGGHGHDPAIKPDTSWQADPRSLSLLEQEQMFLICGSALERKLGQGYASRKVYKPLAKVFPILTLSGEEKHMSARVD
jgi:predicted phosphodiesterase